MIVFLLNKVCESMRYSYNMFNPSFNLLRGIPNFSNNLTDALEVSHASAVWSLGFLPVNLVKISMDLAITPHCCFSFNVL